jgi:hypothetical protein
LEIREIFLGRNALFDPDNPVFAASRQKVVRFRSSKRAPPL